MRSFILLLLLGLGISASGAEIKKSALPPVPILPAAIENAGQDSDAEPVAPLSLNEVPKNLSPFDTAQWFFRKKDYRNAENVVQGIIDNENSSQDDLASANLMLADIARIQHKDSKALVILNKWTNTFPAHPLLPKVNFTLGQIYRNMHSYDRAREYFYRALSSDVAMAVRSENGGSSLDLRLSQAAKWELAETEFQAENWDRSYELFQRFKVQNPEAEELCQAASYRQADCLYCLNKTPDAIKAYERILATASFHPFAPEAWLKLITLYGRAGQMRQKGKALETFIWLIHNSYPKQEAYWQRRCASILIEFVKDRPDDVRSLLTALETSRVDDGWTALTLFFRLLAARQDTPLDDSAPASPEDKAWRDWRRQVEANNDKYKQRLADMKAQEDALPH